MRISFLFIDTLIIIVSGFNQGFISLGLLIQVQASVLFLLSISPSRGEQDRIKMIRPFLT